jgi:hypothetical protein
MPSQCADNSLVCAGGGWKNQYGAQTSISPKVCYVLPLPVQRAKVVAWSKQHAVKRADCPFAIDIIQSCRPALAAGAAPVAWVGGGVM